MKYFFVAVLLLPVLVFAEGRTGNGGGGVIIKGNHLTIPESDISVEGQLLIQMPELVDLNEKLWDLHLPPSIFRRLLTLANPSHQRTYYELKNPDPAKVLEIKKAYSRILKLPMKQVAVYAITDPNSQTTFLLPDYFKLKLEQETSILFHELLWILNPKLTYEDVIYGEELFHQFVEDPDYRWDDLSVYLAQITGDSRIAIFPALSVVPRVHPISGEYFFGASDVQCFNEAQSDEVRKECLSKWAFELTEVTGMPMEFPAKGRGHGPLPPLFTAIANYYKIGGDISLNVQHIPDGWEKMEAVGVTDGEAGRLRFLDKDGHSAFEVIFSGDK